MTLDNRKDLLIYGAGGFAREIAWLASAYNEIVDTWRLVAYLDDKRGKAGDVLHGVPILPPEDARKCFPSAAAVIGVGNPATRTKMAAKLDALGVPFATLIHPRTEYGPRITFGDGTLVCAGNILTTDITIGRHVHINLDCTVGHDVVIQDCVTIAPGAHISGNVRILNGAEIGTGAVIRQGVTVGFSATVGMGAVVTKDVPNDETWVGNPARPMKRKRRWWPSLR